jgi:peptide deformylase
MILPIQAYGSSILRTVCKDISQDYPGLDRLIEDMWETMYSSSGVGLAAPQVNKDIRLFVIDSTQIYESMDVKERAAYPDAPGVKRVFINAHILELTGPEWTYNEGCLSIPKIRDDIQRPQQVRLAYVDEQFNPCEEVFKGITARVILHEYDHIDGKLIIDHFKPLKRKLISGKLEDITKGKVRVDYKMAFPR